MSASGEPSGAEGLDDSVRALVENLRRVYREPDRAKRPIYDAQIASQNRHSLALLSISQFLSSVGLEPDLVDQITSISAAFYDSARGLHPTVFKAHSPGGGRKNDNTDVWAARAVVVIALICFVASGTKDEKTAAHLIAGIVTGDENYRPLLRLVRPGAALESAILNWRNVLSHRKGRIDIRYGVFRWNAEVLKLRVLAVGGAPTKEQYRDWALEYLRKAAEYVNHFSSKMRWQPACNFQASAGDTRTCGKTGPRGEQGEE